jgi:hypothetical protein
MDDQMTRKIKHDADQQIHHYSGVNARGQARTQ